MNNEQLRDEFVVWLRNHERQNDHAPSAFEISNWYLDKMATHHRQAFERVEVKIEAKIQQVKEDYYDLDKEHRCWQCCGLDDALAIIREEI